MLNYEIFRNIFFLVKVPCLFGDCEYGLVAAFCTALAYFHESTCDDVDFGAGRLQCRLIHSHFFSFYLYPVHDIHYSLSYHRGRSRVDSFAKKKFI